MEQLYKAGLAKQDKQITKDKVTPYQIKSDKPKDHMISNGLEKSENSKTTDSKPISEDLKSSDAAFTSDDVTRTATYDTATTMISATTTTSNTALILSTIVTASCNSNTVSSNSGTTGAVTAPLPTATSSIVPSSTVFSSTTGTTPIVISNSTITIPATKDSASGTQPNSIPSEESIATSSNKVEDVRGTEPKIGQKRPATDTGASTPTKRTREMLRSSLQQLLEGKGSVSEDDTPKTPTKSTNITGLNNLAVTICYS